MTKTNTKYQYGQKVVFNNPDTGLLHDGVVVDPHGADDTFIAEVYLGPLEVYEAKIAAGDYDEAHEPTWLAYDCEVDAV